ncbi:universal stress protein [Sulfitobacter aestuariivivens]|uniref:Universal stress protein n=1 Tax=Sulfitobacter aestuariivivens TaxID=2766981 RepID=A0A927D5E4_9RHOB|nr:universal stress protein [Sulfitobacter aestuariivivens]MBD3664139.1 universal stress protein [Sulfitobacter aestuariivivens]
MYNHILIPVSFDENRDASGAIEIAKALLSAEGRISLVHVIEPLPVHVEDALTAEIRKSHRDRAQSRLDALSEENGITDTFLLKGHAGRTIADWAKDKDADCIVISSHKPVFSDIFLGSTASWVVRHAGCAVHVLR